jgi:hypothetical protein
MPTVFLDDGWYLDLSYFLVRLWDSNISIFKLCSFTVHFLAFLKKKKTVQNTPSVTIFTLHM